MSIFHSPHFGFINLFSYKLHEWNLKLYFFEVINTFHLEYSQIFGLLQKILNVGFLGHLIMKMGKEFVLSEETIKSHQTSMKFLQLSLKVRFFYCSIGCSSYFIYSFGSNYFYGFNTLWFYWKFLDYDFEVIRFIYAFYKFSLTIW